MEFSHKPASLYDQGFVFNTLMWKEFGFESEADLKMFLFMGAIKDFDYVLRAHEGNEILFFNLAALEKMNLWLEIKSRPQEQKNKARNSEASVRNLVARKNKGTIEVWTPVGVIDVLTDSEVIEIKDAKNWKHGLGQVLAYGEYYPDRKKRLHLVGAVSKNFSKEQINTFCLNQGVLVTWNQDY